MSLSPHLDAHTIFDPCWDIDRLLDLGMDLSLPMTVRTPLGDLLSRSMTGATGARLFHHAKYCLHAFADLSRSMTGATLLGFSSFATTVMTTR